MNPFASASGSPPEAFCVSRENRDPSTSSRLSPLGRNTFGCLLAILLYGLALGCQRQPPADVTIINGPEPETIDPHVLTGLADGRIAGALFEGLTRYEPVSARPIPGLAERWDISTNGLIYTFHLRTDAVWSTGEPITAEDFVWSWRRVVDPRTGADYAGQLFYVKNGEALNTGKLTDFTQLGIHAMDRFTLKIELDNPTPFFPDLCALRTLAIVPRWVIEKHGDQWIRARPLPSSGSYTLEYWRLNDRIRLRKNPRYWDAANTRSEVIDCISSESSSAVINLFLTGRADIVWDKNLFPQELSDELLKRPQQFHTFDYLGNYFFRFNITRKPFDDVRVRRAIALVIDKRRIVERITRAGEKTASNLVPPNTGGYFGPEGLGYDVAEAQRLLAAAGFPEGRGCRVFEYMVNGGGGGGARMHEQIAIEMQQMLQQHLGLRMEIRPVEWKTYLSEQSLMNYDLCRGSWIGDYDDPNTFLDLFTSNNGNNRTGWANPRYDALIREGNATLDRDQRFALLRQAETLLVRDEVPIVPIFHYVGFLAFDTNRVGGVFGNLTDEHPFWAIYRKPSRP